MLTKIWNFFKRTPQIQPLVELPVESPAVDEPQTKPVKTRSKVRPRAQAVYGTVSGTIPLPDVAERLCARDNYIKTVRGYDVSFPVISNPTDNTATGMIGEDGGIYLAGSFTFTTDTTGTITSGTIHTQQCSNQAITSGKIEHDGTFCGKYGKHDSVFEGVIKTTTGRVTGKIYSDQPLISGSMTGIFAVSESIDD